MQMSRFLFFKSCTIRTIGFTIRTNRTIHYKSIHITNHLAEKLSFEYYQRVFINKFACSTTLSAGISFN